MEPIKILGVRYDVKEVPVISRDTFLLGEIDYINQVICLDESLHADRRRAVLLHEVLHGIFDALGFVEQNNDEHLVQSLAVAINQVLLDNKGLLT